MINIVVVLATFAVIFPAELPDKSMFAAVVLGTRFRPLYVWLGLAAAFLVHVIIAVAAGGVISLLPKPLVIGVVTLFFLAGAALMFFQRMEVHDEAEEEALVAKAPKSSWKIAATAFGIVFVSEWGDLTQIATVNLAARYGDPLSVALGATTALWLVTGLGVLLGRRLVRSVPIHLVKRIAGLVLLALAIWSFVDFLEAI